MAKIGTAQVEIKPVLNEDALNALCAEVERRIAEAVQRGYARPVYPTQQVPYPPMIWSGSTGTSTTLTTTHADPAQVAKRTEQMLRQRGADPDDGGAAVGAIQ